MRLTGEKCPRGHQDPRGFRASISYESVPDSLVMVSDVPLTVARRPTPWLLWVSMTGDIERPLTAPTRIVPVTFPTRIVPIILTGGADKNRANADVTRGVPSHSI